MSLVAHTNEFTMAALAPQGTHPLTGSQVNDRARTRATGQLWGRLLGVTFQTLRSRVSYGSASTYSGCCQVCERSSWDVTGSTRANGISMAAFASQGTHPSTGWSPPCISDRSRVFFLDSLTNPGRRFIWPAHLTVSFSLRSRQRGNPTDRSTHSFGTRTQGNGHRGG